MTDARHTPPARQGNTLREDLQLRLAMAVAQADGRVTPEELDRIRNEARDRLHTISSSQQQLLEQLLGTLEHEPQDSQLVAGQLTFQLSTQERTRLLSHLFDIALADAIFVPAERALLEELHGILGTQPAEFEKLLQDALNYSCAPHKSLSHLFDALRQRKLGDRLRLLLGAEGES